MARELKTTSVDIGHPLTEPLDAVLALKPAELEALIDCLCSCSTRRAKSNEPRKLRVGCCCQRARTEWCQLGERVAGSVQYIDTKFG
jgi:hypothetical protein